MLDTGLAAGSCRAVWTNETTMYVELDDLFGDFARLLCFGGRYVCIAGCYNDVTGGRSEAVGQIDEHYTCHVHPRSAYLAALAHNGLVPINLTAQTIPYGSCGPGPRSPPASRRKFLTAYREGSFHYLLIAADFIGT
jgi:geranyl diphosphate 2-C-methyltransferase